MIVFPHCGTRCSGRGLLEMTVPGEPCFHLQHLSRIRADAALCVEATDRDAKKLARG